MLLTASEMRAVEEAAFARGVSAEKLMEQAGVAIAAAARRYFDTPGRAVVFCGKGNNAGDMLVAARELARLGWAIQLDLAFPETALSPLPSRKLAELLAVPPVEAAPSSVTIALDGLLGIGAGGPPREPVASAIKRINSLRLEHGAFVIAADLPSGLDADSGVPADPCVIADLTVTIGHCKTGLVADAAANHVGRLSLAALPELTTEAGDAAGLITPDTLHALLPPRPFDSHKGTWGRVGIIAGSRGLLGAARLSSAAALHAGAGLVTLYATPGIYDLLAVSVEPEIMVRPVDSYLEVLDERLDAVGIGPGLGQQHGEAVREIVTRLNCPAVVDADALNAIAATSYDWSALAAPRLLTPHPGEMARLSPDTTTLTRREIAELFTATRPVTLLLKGARTIITERGFPPVFNTTGDPGMGSGGMGDVLTGVCTALMASGQSPRHAAMLGAWICGRAAEHEVFDGGSSESLSASDVIRQLGAAFREIRHGCAAEAACEP